MAESSRPRQPEWPEGDIFVWSECVVPCGRHRDLRACWGSERERLQVFETARDSVRRSTRARTSRRTDGAPESAPRRDHLRSAPPPTTPSRLAEVAAGSALRCKRCFDLVIGGLTLLLLLPLFAVIALWVLISSGRPVLYRQTRVGRHGQPFTMFKFRSMVPDAHDQRHDLQEHNERRGPLFKIHHDPRVTTVGRFLRVTSLDELPQFFNVFGGSMSLVGPRPALYEERESFPPELLAREQTRPGITGLWQVEARRDPDFDRYHELDLEYVRSWTLWLDVRLLVRTPFVIVREFLHTRAAPAVPALPVAVQAEPERDETVRAPQQR